MEPTERWLKPQAGLSKTEMNEMLTRFENPLSHTDNNQQEVNSCVSSKLLIYCTYTANR